MSYLLPLTTNYYQFISKEMTNKRTIERNYLFLLLLASTRLPCVWNIVYNTIDLEAQRWISLDSTIRSIVSKYENKFIFWASEMRYKLISLIYFSLHMKCGHCANANYLPKSSIQYFSSYTSLFYSSHL